MKILHQVMARSGLKNGEKVWENTPISSGMATYLLLNRRRPSQRKNGELAKLADNMVGKKEQSILRQTESTIFFLNLSQSGAKNLV